MSQKNIHVMFVLFFCIVGTLYYAVVENHRWIKEQPPEQIIQYSSETIVEPVPEGLLDGWIGERFACGADDRVSSNDPAIGRVRIGANGVCTGFIIANGLLVTAGHCTGLIETNGEEDVIEFNVKSSLGDGTIVSSDPEDRYVIDEQSIVDFRDSFSDIDWGVFRVHDNVLTGLQPIQKQDAFYEIEQPNTSLTTTIRITGYGNDTGSDNNTQQTHSRTDTYSVSDLIDYQIDTEGGNSGSPIIDVNSGKAIGVNAKQGCPSTGTTFRNSGFWAAANPGGSFTTQLNQKRESGSQLSGSIIGEWSGSSFIDRTISGTLPTVGSVFGEIEVFRGAQNLVSSPDEKYNQWVADTEELTDVSNHREFLIRSNATLTSQFKKVYNATIKNYFLEATSLNPSSDVVYFKDPWLIDFNDPEYGNQIRNRGYFAPFKSVMSGSSNNLGTGTSYKGVFLNQSFSPSGIQYYSVLAPENIDFGGALGNRPVLFMEWGGDYVSFENANADETALVFTAEDAEARANLKISNATDTFANNGATGQRKIVRTANGWLHRVYESLGHVWYETKSPTGDWEIITSHGTGNKHVDATGGKSPSIEIVSDDSTPNYPNSVIVAWQEGVNIRMRVYYYIASYNAYLNYYEKTIPNAATSSSNDSKPNLAYRGEDEFIVLWESATGLKFEMFEINGSGIESIMDGSIPGTDGSSRNAAIATNKQMPVNPYYEIAWVQYGSLGASTIQYIAFGKFGSSGSYYAHFYPASPLTVSSSSSFSNTSVSLISTSDEATMGWRCTSVSYWSPMSYQACLRSYDFTSLSSFSTFNQSVQSATIAKSGSGTDYYFAWSEKYYYPESQYNTDVNKYVKKGAFSNKRTLNTTAPYIHLYDAPSGSDMKLSAFYTGTPKYYILSNALETSAKRTPEKSLVGRGVFVTKGSAGAYFELGSLFIDNEAIDFEEVIEVKPEGGQLERIRSQDSLKVKKLEDVAPFLLSKPFDLNPETSFTFSEQFGIGDSLALANALGEKGEISFSVELVNEGNTRVVATLKSVKMGSKSLRPQKEKGYQVTIPKELSGKFRVRITPGSNLEGLSFELATSYRDGPSQSGKEKTKLDPEEVNVITDYDLAQNYPNPFNPSTQIEYQIPNAGLVQLEVFDILGRKVQTLVNETKEVGKYTVTFDASGLASGVYLYRLTSGSFTASKKLYLIK